jgi:hypothetical protein
LDDDVCFFHELVELLLVLLIGQIQRTSSFPGCQGQLKQLRKLKVSYDV